MSETIETDKQRRSKVERKAPITSEDDDIEQQSLLESSSSSKSDSPTDNPVGKGGGGSGSIQVVKEEMVKNGKVIGACAFYSFCSVSMVLANKSLASR